MNFSIFEARKGKWKVSNGKYLVPSGYFDKFSN